MNKVVSIDRMQVGAKGGGKHWTKEEITQREQAAKKTIRKTKANLEVPDYVKANAGILKIWEQTISRMAGLEILDDIDADVLGVYCDAVYNHSKASQQIMKTGGYVTCNDKGTEAVNPHVKAAQGYARIIMDYAGKLGITAEARARLAKKLGDKGGKTKKELDQEKRKKKMFGA